MEEKREIKYRLWDKENKKMIDCGGFIFDCFNPTIYDCKFASLNLFIKCLNEKYDLTQFIGIQDKNGKYIYEGDIIKYKYIHFTDYKRNDPIFGLVIWNKEECRFCIKQLTDEKHGEDYSEAEIKFYNFGDKLFNWNEIEIVGNKFENPDLII